MKTSRLYYDDSYLREFDAEVIETIEVENRPAVVLSQSAFYPTSGGQPHDIGTINDVPVINVMDEGGTVFHVLENPLSDELVHGQIAWRRRFDHMQHHSGQHILSRAFINIVDAETVGFHLSENSVTIDLDKQVSETDIEQAELLANQVVAENRAVRAWFPISDELATLQLRKISDKITGAIRVVDVGGFDLVACGGTHVAHTGEIGLIKVTRSEKVRSKFTRIEFCCGERALLDYRQKNTFLNDLAARNTTTYQVIPDMLDKLREENKALKKSLKAARETLIGYQSAALWNEAVRDGDKLILVTHILEDDYEAGDVQLLANQLVQNPQTIALLGLSGDPAHLVFARSNDLDLDVVPLLKKALEILGSQRGGGRPNIAQGGGVPATKGQIESAFVTIRQMLK